MSNKLTNIAKELLTIEADLPFRFDYSNGENPSVDDFELYTFEQNWGSTALGFGGMGGQKVTAARTYVLVPMFCNQKCFVYFGCGFAYAADYTEAFKDDLKRQNMEPVYRASKYNKKDINENEV